MSIQTQNSFPGLFGPGLLPFLTTITFDRFKQRAPEFPQFYRMMTSTREMEQTHGFTGLGNLVKKGEGAPTSYDSALQLFPKTFTHEQFTLGYRITKIMLMNDRYALMAKMAKALGRSAAETRELYAADLINSNPTGPDGVALFSASHPLVKSGGLQSNRLGVTSDLDTVSMELALTAYRQLKNHEGQLCRVQPGKLVVPPALEWRGIELLSGTMKSGTADNTVNAFRNRQDGEGNLTKLTVWNYLTDPAKWYIWPANNDEHELRWYDREKFNVQYDEDFDTRTKKAAGWAQWSNGSSGGFEPIFGGF